MGIKLKSLASAVTLGFALLFLGPSTSTAKADQFGRHGSFNGRHGSVNGRHGFDGRQAFAHRSFGPARHGARGFARPFRTFGPRVGVGFARPYRLVRVFVYDPFPRWVYRRVYDVPYTGAYCPY